MQQAPADVPTSSEPSPGLKRFAEGSTESTQTDTFRLTVDKTTLAFAQVSFILSATVTPFGVWVISSVVNRIFSTAQLEKVFDLNTTFESNWKHPRHIVSLVAASLSIPLIVKRLFDAWTSRKNIPKEQNLLEAYAYWTVLTNRPVLHLCNQLAQKILNLFK